MALHYLKTATKTSATGDADVRETVATLLTELEFGREAAARRQGEAFDRWRGDILVDDSARAAARAAVPVRLQDDIRYARDNILRFAEAQRAAILDTEIEVIPGLFAGHRNLPMHAAGCYVPGGRYAHIASAIMSVTTARAAGVARIVACSPPLSATGIHPATLYALDVCGADVILNLGGVAAIGAMAFGLFGNPPVDILVGPGNQYVAEAKRALYGRVAIDMFAGPTESAVIADGTADPDIVAADLVGQAEHGHNSPVWLIALDPRLATDVIARIESRIESLPEPNRSNAAAAWRDYAEVVVADSREEAVTASDAYASEHLQVLCADLPWWHEHLRHYGSLFLGAETTVAFGDKVSGPNHILPTRQASRYTGGLSVGKFLRTVTWQRMSREASREVAPVCARISRAEGMEGHARSADVRLEKWFPDERFDLGAGAPGTDA
jgi:sulfopropanediol 3-dehydrogenase